MAAARPPAIGRRTALSIGVFSLVVVLAHLPYLEQAPDDLDSLNFALGVRHFDVTLHQPHPPGAPVYIALGRGALALAQALGLRAHPLAGRESVALTLLAALSAGVLTVALWRVFAMIAPPGPTAGLGAALAVTCPLVWLLSAQPLSDIPGLTAAAIAQGALLGGSRRSLMLGAAAAGLAAGIRAQAIVLTVPLLIFRLVKEWRRNRRQVTVKAAVAWGLGMIVWCGALAFQGEGLAAYAQAVAAQAREDFSSGMLVWSVSSAREIARAIAWATILPWGTRMLAALALVLAAGGTIVMVRARARRELATIALIWGPYLAFHFLVQEPWTVRYALPLVPPVAYAAARAIAALPRAARAGVAMLALLATAGSSAHALAVDAAAGTPLYRLAGDMTDEAQRQREPPLVLSHFAPGIALRRVEQLMSRPPAWRRIPPRRGYAWLQIADVWRANTTERLWFVANPRRTDLALLDPSSLRLVGTYRRPAVVQWLLAGSRPSALSWYEMTRPNWVALEGWALTPETAGIATRDRRGPDVAPITALVRPLGEPTILLIGGRHLGAADGPPARITVRLGDKAIRSFEVHASRRDFLKMIALPSGRGSEEYASLTIAASAPDGTPAPIAIEQFDYQPAQSVVVGFGRGWHEREFNPRRGRLWRWTTAQADLQIYALRDVRLQLVGESPRRYFRAPARLTVRAGNVIVAERRLQDDFREELCVPGRLLNASGGRLTLATDRTFVPSERGRSPDHRTLGLRIFDLKVVAADCGGR